MLLDAKERVRTLVHERNARLREIARELNEDYTDVEVGDPLDK
mgnify:CR=1 FL=1